jgi:hypothetical protein
VPGLNPSPASSPIATKAPGASPTSPDRASVSVRAQGSPRRVPAAHVTTGDARLDAFARGERAVVVTGQQAGLSRSLLTLVKAAAALGLANDLSLGAVFWCASEDHDLVEATRCRCRAKRPEDEARIR